MSMEDSVAEIWFSDEGVIVEHIYCKKKPKRKKMACLTTNINNTDSMCACVLLN